MQKIRNHNGHKGIPLPKVRIFRRQHQACPVYELLQFHSFLTPGKQVQRLAVLSITVLRKSVIDKPAVLTIFGTREAAVIPGIVFISRK